MTTPNIRTALERLVELNEGCGANEWADAIAAARAALAEPEPPADGEVAELVAWLREQAEYHSINIGSSRVPRFTRAADLLSRLTPQPVPEGPTEQRLPVAASDRLPAPSDCDAIGRCWWASTLGGEWILAPSMPGARFWAAHSAHAALAEPVPEGPSDEELLAMRSWSSHSHTFDSDLVGFARAVLQKWGRQ